MQDLSKIEQEHLQANDVGDDAPAGLTRDVAEKFSKDLCILLLQTAALHFDDSGMQDLLGDDEMHQCVKLLSAHLQDAIGDMPIWDIVKRGEA